MASIVKRLRPRIVVPICVGSNPTTRPIKKLIANAISFLICEKSGFNTNPTKRSLVWVRADLRTAFMPDSEGIEQT